MANLQNFFVNPYNKGFEQIKQSGKDEISKRTSQAANELFKDKTFADEQKGAYLLARITKYLSNLVSFFTALFAAQAILSFILGAYISYALALGLCALLELLKNSFWAINVKQFLRYKKKPVLGFAVLFLLSSISILASLYGAYIAPSALSKPPQIGYSSRDSLVLKELSYINTQIEQQDKILLGVNEKAIPNQSGKISGTLKNAIGALTAQKDSLSAQKSSLIAQAAQIEERAAQEEQIALREHLNSLGAIKIACLILSLIFEVLYISSSIYCFYYLFRVFVDITPAKRESPSLERNNREPIKSASQAPQLPSSKIGFKQYPDVVDEGGVKYILYNSKKYTKADIKNNVYAFRAKVKKYKNTPKESSYKAHLIRWEGFLQRLL